jgi:DNA-binding GntR family transcriptional regulator
LESLVSPTTLVDQAYAVILDAICDGTLTPGERLTQTEIAERLNVSRQPIHNALLVLKAQGFLREAGRRGLCVAPLDPALFEAIYQFRSAIEPLAVRLATERMTPADLAQGRALIEQGVKAMKEQGGAAIRADVAFHSWIYDLSGNAMIVRTMHVNWQHLRRTMGEVLRHPSLSTRVWSEHRAIVDAMANGDAEKAAILIGSHVISAYEDVRATLGKDLEAKV